MITEQTDTLVLKDATGDYYLVPQQLVERGRVPAEHTAELEHLVAQTIATERDDTQGHFWPLLIIAGSLGLGTALVIGYSDRFGIGPNLDGPLPAAGESWGGDYE
jgi:hypothetical protein